MNEAAAVILIGGKSSRMGTDKAKVQYKGIPLLKHCQQVLSSSNINELFISGNNGIRDEIENLGPIGGISSSLNHLKLFEIILFTPVDMPLLTAQTYDYLLQQKFDKMVYYKNYHMPFVIRNNNEVRKSISELIASKKLAIHQLIKKLNAQEIELSQNSGIEEKLFVNINTPDQLAQISQ
jgi:molybdopterin-guanine dinucleotide biosynthesis protein A